MTRDFSSKSEKSLNEQNRSRWLAYNVRYRMKQHASKKYCIYFIIFICVYPARLKCIRINFPKREELLLRTVLALPKASKTFYF